MGANGGDLQAVRSDGGFSPKQDPVQHHGQAGKSSAPEETPLLHNENPNDVDAAAIPGDKLHSENHQSRRRWASIKRWLWKNRLAVCIVILLLGGIAALLAYFAVYDKGGQKAPAVCLTPACVQAASVILNAMSPKYSEINPCVDFNKFTCQGFDDTHELRADQDALLASTIMSENGQRILRRVLETPYSSTSSDMEKHSSTKEAIFKKLRDSYDACMDEDSIKAAGTAPLIGILREVEELFMAESTGKSPLNHYSLPGQAQREMLSHKENALSEVVAFLTSIDVTTFLTFDVQADDRDPDATVISLDAPRQPGLSSKVYYKDPAIVAKYTHAVGEVLGSLIQVSRQSEIPVPSGVIHLLAKGAELAQGIVSLEAELAEATPSEEDFEDITKSYNPMSVAEAQALLPQLSISYIISRFAPPGCKPTKLIVGSPSYLKAASKILEKTSAEALQAYLAWKTIQSFTYTIEDDALKPIKRLNNELKGTDPDAVQERWRTCISRADGDLGWILSKFFVEEAFSEDAKRFGDRVVSEIKAQFVRRLGVADWMSKEVRELGIQKVHNIIQKIGYPTKSPDIRNSSDLQAYYKPVEITESSFFNNTLSVAKASVKREWSALCKPTDRAVWGMTADTVNAYYNPAGNEIVFPAGILQSPVFYSPEVPQYLSYGTFGSISGHELSHAFDSTGRHYDETGNYTDWWDDKTIEEFQKKTQCFIDQYHEFTIETPDGGSLHVNGKLTLPENIADAGGINAAFASWKRSEAENPGQLLPGLQHFTKEQLFFISYSMFWCGKVRPEAAVNRIYRDTHSPAWVRIMGTTANSPDFREAFNCPVKEPTCKLW